MDLHPIRPVEFDWHLKPLTGNVISMDLHSNRLASISMDLHPIQPVELGGNSLRL